MRHSNKQLYAISTVITSFLPLPLKAVCPVCALAVGAGVGFTKWLGIDDTITGLWIGGLTASLIAWTVSFLTRHNIVFYGRKILVTVFYFASMVGGLSYSGYIGHPFNKLWGMDKLLLGIGIGAIAFAFGCYLYRRSKEKNNGHARFAFQKVVYPVGVLVVLSLIFYGITR